MCAALLDVRAAAYYLGAAACYLGAAACDLRAAARDLRAAARDVRTAARAVRAWPTWALLQDPGAKVPTELELPIYTPPAEGAPPPKVEGAKAARKKGFSEQVRDLFSTPRKTAITLTIPKARPIPITTAL